MADNRGRWHRVGQRPLLARRANKTKRRAERPGVRAIHLRTWQIARPVTHFGEVVGVFGDGVVAGVFGLGVVPGVIPGVGCGVGCGFSTSPAATVEYR